MVKYHFIGGDGKTYGPYTVEQMRQFMAENRLDEGSQVSIDKEVFMPVSSFPELMAAPVAQIPATPPVQPSAVPMSGVKPGKIQAIAIITLVQGIMGIIGGLLVGLSFMCLYVPFIYGIVYGIMATIKGSTMLGQNPWPAYQTVRTTAIMGIVNVINCDFMFGVTGGIIILVFLNDPEVKTYIQSRGQRV